MKLEHDRILRSIQIAPLLQLVQSKESVVSPTLAHLEVAGELSDYIADTPGSRVLQHLYLVLVLASLGHALHQLQED